MSNSLENMIRKGDRALENGETLVAMVQFERAYAIEPTPRTKARLAYCLAKERRHYQKALSLCREALEAEPDNPGHYYQLGRIYLLAENKRMAIKSLRKGLKFKRHQPSIDELTRLGARKGPIFSSLPREHFLNRSVGLLLAKLGSR